MQTALLAAVAAAAVQPASSAPQQKIALSMLNAVHAYGVDWYPPSNASALLDEQAVAGDPARAGAGGRCNTSWALTWDKTWWPPLSVQQQPFMWVNLNGTYDITSVWAYRGYGHFNVSLQVTDSPADPAAATDSALLTVGSPPGQGWISANFSTPARGSYVTVGFSGPTGNAFYELVVYGTLVQPVPVPPAAPALPEPMLSEFLGTNGFALDTMHNLTGIVGAMREYDDWTWTEKTQNENSFQPTASNDFLLDSWYQNLSALGIKGHQCTQKSASFIHGGNASQAGWKPLTAAELSIIGSAMVATNYATVAAHAYQVAARYGSVTVPAANLRLAPNQPVRSGLGTMSGLEIWNEVDGTWNGGRNGYFTPAEYAAMLSAAYDGHVGGLGPLMGAKAADPTFPVIHSGLAGINRDYIEGVRQWASAFRSDKRFPADVLNVHSYCRNTTSGQGAPPEACPLGPQLLELCAYRDANLPSLPIWLSEFGYDTVGGPSVAPRVAHFTQQQVQGMWLLRTVLLLARLRSPSGGPCVTRAHMYMYADVESTSGGVFATSGLVSSADLQYAPKVSYYFYSAFFKALSSFTFAGMVTVPGVAPGSLLAQCFKDSALGVYAIVVWSATASGAEVAVQLPVATPACPVFTGSTLELLTPQNASLTGNVTYVPVTGSGATATAAVTITEVPAILRAG